MSAAAGARAALRPIGLMGGTFDPVHNGHLRLAIEACEALALDHVRLIPLCLPYHRDAPVASPPMRAAMLEAAARPPLVVDRCEIERGGVSYTVDTLAHMRARWPERSLVLLIGLDAYHGLPRWHRADEVLSLAHIVVASRPDIGTTHDPALDELVANAQAAHVDALHDTCAGRVFFLDIPLLPIASSELRARRAAGRSIRHLVPESVDDLITEHSLYFP
ncbi:MAG: nicotinate-nucleotide adenylyltransferase [Proteobacteria bacterium]|nr:nicotinate-nucleotide adenylyltransferase [Pseudomonadota bacterium]